MLKLSDNTRIYVAEHAVDFRKAINGLAALIVDQLTTPVNDGSVYVFYNRDFDRVKCLFWDKNGFVLYHKRLELDNNLSERTIKPFVIGRKNWLFHGNDLGAKAGSILFSLIETCKQNKIETFSWFKYVLTHIRQVSTLEQLEERLPYNIDSSLLTDMRSLPKLIIPEKGAVN